MLGGQPQTEFKSLHIGAMNKEIDRLNVLVASLTPPLIKQPLTGQPTLAVPMITAPVAFHVTPGRAAGLSLPLSRHQLLSTLELFPAVEVTGAESDETLQAILKNASGEAGIRLPGEPADPTPGELRQQKLNQILSAPAQEVSAGAWTLESLSALTDAVFGVGTAKAETRTVHYYDPASPTAILAAKMNSFPPGSYEWRKLDAEMRKAERTELSAQSSPQVQQSKIEALRTFLCASGLRIPGLSFAGLKVSERAKGLHPKELVIAQDLCDRFCAVMAGDVEAGRSSHAAAAAARKCIATQTKQPFVLGMVAVPESSRAQLDAEKYPYSTIPKR